jgi:hypothetical protein
MTSDSRTPTWRQIGYAEAVLVPLGMVVLPVVVARSGASMSVEVGVSVMLLVAFGSVPTAVLVRNRRLLRQFPALLRRSNKAKGLCAGAAIVFGGAALAAASGTWGLATAWVLGAALLLSLAVERAAHDAACV